MADGRAEARSTDVRDEETEKDGGVVERGARKEGARKEESRMGGSTGWEVLGDGGPLGMSDSNAKENTESESSRSLKSDCDRTCSLEARLDVPKRGLKCLPDMID